MGNKNQVTSGEMEAYTLNQTPTKHLMGFGFANAKQREIEKMAIISKVAAQDFQLEGANFILVANLKFNTVQALPIPMICDEVDGKIIIRALSLFVAFKTTGKEKSRVYLGRWQQIPYGNARGLSFTVTHKDTAILSIIEGVKPIFSHELKLQKITQKQEEVCKDVFDKLLKGAKKLDEMQKKQYFPQK